MTDRDHDPAERKLAPICKAQGCPLPVDFVTDYWPTERRGQRPRPKWGVCAYHHEAEGVDWMATVERIKAQLVTLRLLALLDKVSDAELVPRTGETVSAWRDRLRQAMRARILPAARSVPPSAEALAALDQILGRDRGAA